MAYQVLARKYRPQNFSDVIGQQHVTKTLQNAIQQQRIAHGYIFSGHRGIGKTTVARILAMALNCRAGDTPRPEPCGKCESCTEIRAGGSVDVIEIDAATNRGIDEIRELREAARYRPARDRYKIYILDEAHQITDAAFNALLKTLEEPPSHIVFMMATTQPEDIPQTIRSRCQHFSFHAVRFDDIVGQLRGIAQTEKIAVDEDALALLAEAGDGSMRDALSIMDQAIALSGDRVSKQQVLGLVGAVPGEVMEEIMQAVAAGSSRHAVQLLDRLMVEGQSPTHFARQVVRFLRNAVMAKVAGADTALLQVSSDERARVARIAEIFSEEDLARFLQIMLRSYGDISYKADQRFHLELAILKLVHAQRLLPMEELLSEVTPERQGARPPLLPAPGTKSNDKPSAGSRPEAASANARTEPAFSPFQQDRARKHGGGEMAATAVAVAEAPEAHAPRGAAEERVAEARSAVIAALEDAGHRMLASTLDGGHWKFEGNVLTIQAPVAASLIEMAMNAEARQIANAAAARILGSGTRLKIEAAPNGSSSAPATGQTNGSRPTSAPAGAESAPSARQRAANDPVVRRLQEKFGADIRTVIDHREKRTPK